MITPRKAPKPLSPDEVMQIRTAAAEEFRRNPPPPGTPAQLALAEQVMVPAVRCVLAEQRENAA
jgi:hypothetical protein